MIVAGVMSGTSADGINVALVRISESKIMPVAGRRARSRDNLQVKLLAHAEYPYRKDVRRTVLAAMNARRISVADLSRLNFLLGELYADTVLQTQRRFRLRAELVGCHGQTIYHQGDAAPFLGRSIAATWQTGDGSVIAARTGIPVVSDFRPADIAAGGKGAPLVPFLDYVLYRHQQIGRIMQNIGGIANLTAIPAGASSHQLVAFDTGPGNMVIDAVTERLFGRAYDRDGHIAASGNALNEVIQVMLRDDFFRRKPPKTAGREEFGREFVTRFLQRCGRATKANVVATATALTAQSIAAAISRFVLSCGTYTELIASGGGTKNATLMAMLANSLRPMGIELRSCDEFGLPAEAKEAVAFAVLAYETWQHRPSTIPSATGAQRPALLGKISYA